MTATSAGSVLVLTAKEFHSLLESEPSVAVRLLPAIGQRLRAVLSDGPPDAPVV